MRHADAKMAIHLNGAENTQAFVKEIGVGGEGFFLEISQIGMFRPIG